MNIRKGDKIKLVKPMGIFDNVGEICEILDVQKPLNTLCSEHDKTTISFSFGHGAHLGVMSEDELVTYFEVLPRKCSAVQQLADDIYDKAVFRVDTVFEKCVIVSARLPNGYIIVESHAAASPKDFDENACVKKCLAKIKGKIRELESYRLREEVGNRVDQ